MSLARKREEAEDFVQQDLTARLTVQPDGTARDVSTDAAQPEAAARPLVSALRRSRWRPAIIEGETVETAGVTHTEVMLLKPPRD
jgi:hypothetical protein